MIEAGDLVRGEHTGKGYVEGILLPPGQKYELPRERSIQRAGVSGYDFVREDSLELITKAKDLTPNQKGEVPEVTEFEPGDLVDGYTWNSKVHVQGTYVETDDEGDHQIRVTKILDADEAERRAYWVGSLLYVSPETATKVLPNIRALAVEESPFEKHQVRMSVREGVLMEANELIHGERNAHYGSPTENFDRTAALWNVQLGHKLKDGEQFTATDVAMLMVQLKMARLVTSPGKRDNIVDAVGYLACGAECKEAEAQA